MATARGRALGKYQLIAEIARGGMGIVYLAMVQGPGGFHKLVVVKELNPGVVEEPAFLTMFLDEARLAARLNHPNIVQTNEVGNDGDRYFLAMDYLDGRGLDHVRRRSRNAGQGLSQSMYLRVLCDMLAGLDYAHRLADFDGSPLGVVHRDVSPQNVFVTFDGSIKLLDFGIAKAKDSLHETHAGVFKGKVSYMSPEQARGDKVDARADIFSAGVMLWEALTGRRTREGQNDQEKLWALVAADLPRASTIKPTVPPELDEICARAMAWNRDGRYTSAADLQNDLERYLATSGTNVTAREVGVCVAEMFREDRATTNALIESFVANARNHELASSMLPVMDVTSRSMGGGTPSRIFANSVSGSQSLEQPSTPKSEIAAAAPSTTHTVVPAPRARTPWIIAGALATLLVAGASYVALTRGDKPADKLADARPERADAKPEPATKPIAPEPAQPKAAAAAAAPIAAGSAAPPHAPRYVNVEIRVSPPDARLAIDDTDVPGNPFAGDLPSDNVVHHVRASAPGYVTKSLPIELDANVSLDLILEHIAPPVRITSTPMPQRPPARPQPSHSAATRAPEPPRAQPSPDPVATPAPPAPTPAPRSSTEVDPNGGSKPRRTIDPSNPYGAEEP